MKNGNAYVSADSTNEQQNAAPLTLDEIKQIELKELVAFDEFCKKHRLTYWLAGGTLLGAIRHKGFIPWDDDIDVYMPHEDYFKLCALVNKGESVAPHYRLGAPSVKDGSLHHCTFAKLYDTRTALHEEELMPSLKVDEGIWIDIFPLIGQPDDEAQKQQLLKSYSRLWSYIRLASYKLDFNASLIGIIARLLLVIPVRLIGVTHYLDKYDDLMRHSPLSSETNVSISPIEPQFPFKSSDFASSVMLEFQGHEFPAPIGWEDVLTSCYGDYMKLPPEEERISLHHFKAYWREGKKDCA